METHSASPEANFTDGSKEGISNQVIGPETGAIRCLFKVSQRHYIGQQILNVERLSEWLVRGHTLEEFRANLWELARPYVKQAIMVETDQNGHLSVCWTDPVRPAIEHANLYITFNNRKIRKANSWESLNIPMIARWDNKGTEIVVFIYMHTTAIASRHINDLVQETLIAPRKHKPVAPPKPRKHLPEGSDGYNFRDEVRALRETFLQMRDLMHILDNRISLLEEKCDQTLQQEPLISMNDAAAAANAVGEMVDIKPYDNPDPLLAEDMKVETLEDDDDAEAFYQ